MPISQNGPPASVACPGRHQRLIGAVFVSALPKLRLRLEHLEALVFDTPLDRDDAVAQVAGRLFGFRVAHLVRLFSRVVCLCCFFFLALASRIDSELWCNEPELESCRLECE